MQQSNDDDGRFWIDTLEDDATPTAELVGEEHDRRQLRQWLVAAMGELNPRERYIVIERKLRDEGRTLQSLGQELNLSKERVRQLEAAAFNKLRRGLEGQSPELQAFLG